MPSAVSPNPRAGMEATDDVDQLFNYDNAVEDFLKDIPLDNTVNNTAPQEPAKDIDEEITVKKKRKPVPKLDEGRLLSDPGLPRLRKIAKTQLKFRGKGHEFSDISRLLNTYQLWLDDLFPRAKFKDALIDVEKVGHSKRMQVMRRAWLDATKPQQRDATPEKDEDFVMSGALTTDDAARNESIFPDSDHELPIEDSIHQSGGGNDSTRSNEPNDGPDDDELDALLAEAADSNHATTAIPVQQKKGPFEEDDSDEDELDALLSAEPTIAASMNQGHETRKAQGPFDDDFAAEEEAMAEMDLW